MKRRKERAGKRTMKNAASGRDPTLRAFEKDDVGDDIVAAATAVVVRPQPPPSTLATGRRSQRSAPSTSRSPTR
jgi:hypothetical protein